MEYLPLLALIIIIPLFLFFNHFNKIRERIIHKILERSLLKQRNKSSWYSSAAVRQAAKALNRLSRRKLQPLLKAIRVGEWSPILRVAGIDGNQEFEFICGQNTNFPTGALAGAEAALLNADTGSAAALIDGFESRSAAEKARLNYLQAWLALEEGDLLSASEKAAAAAKLFQKLGFTYEEAAAYLLSGTIYRVSAVTDTADFMLRSAAELFGFTGATAKEAETWGNLGMLMVMQQRYEEAAGCFDKAEKLFNLSQDHAGATEIINQQALTALICEDYTRAERLAKQAQKAFRQLKDARGEGLSFDILAQIAAARGKWKQTLSAARNAQKFYRQSQNISGLMEMEYLEAQALAEQKEETAAEKILRRIIDRDKRDKSCFHVANAYNLLGLIYLRQDDLRRAEGLFQQSLSAELQNERFYGAAIDYANIALTAYRRGHKEQGDKNREMALRCAKDAGGEDLLKLLETKL